MRLHDPEKEKKMRKNQNSTYFIWEMTSSKFKSSRLSVGGNVMESNGAGSISAGRSISTAAKVVLIVVTIRLQSENR